MAKISLTKETNFSQSFAGGTIRKRLEKSGRKVGESNSTPAGIRMPEVGSQFAWAKAVKIRQEAEAEAASETDREELE